ncbi:Hypothetical protein A9601_14211 [Prochlorococcus marinus str. AS9601]|uniref:Uncharacterized protein n=2 Tax=Prochlorococcus marinus TaxID=1219 RepID=A2BSE4_PROMS|nr:Hypothetical protein A9601_14211 [Prochlorococcus marinus str. AS9601]
MFCSRKKTFEIKSIDHKFIIDKSQIIVFITPANTDIISRLVYQFENNDSYKKRKLICIYIDFYHGYKSNLYNLFTKFYRRIIYNRRNDFLEVSYKLMSLSNTLILGSDFQRDNLLTLYPFLKNKDIYVIPDYIEEIFQKNVKIKKIPDIQKKINILWEGIGYGALIPLLKLAFCSFLLKIKNINSKINFLTDPEISAYSRLTIPTKLVVNLLKLIGTDIQYKKWTKENLIEFSKKSDIAIITVNSLHPATKYKPANKIRLLLSLGLGLVLCPNLEDYLRFEKKYRRVISYSSIINCSKLLFNIFANRSKFKKLTNEKNKIYFNSIKYNLEIDEIWEKVLTIN